MIHTGIEHFFVFFAVVVGFLFGGEGLENFSKTFLHSKEMIREKTGEGELWGKELNN